jgi:trehalose-6-phosphate synthase
VKDATIGAQVITHERPDGQGGEAMQIDPEKVQTQEETGEPAAIDEVEARVEAEMKIIEGRAKERVAQGLQDEKLEQEGERLQEEGKRELEEQ